MSYPDTLSPQAALTRLVAAPYRVVTVRFIRRTDGSLRRMRMIFRPEKTGGRDCRCQPLDDLFLPVWDVEEGTPALVNLIGVLGAPVPTPWTVYPH